MMCGRFTSKTEPSVIAATFHADLASDSASAFTPSYNVAPTQNVLVVAEHNRIRRVGTMRWGLIPSFAKDTSVGSRLINARAETLCDKPAFRRAFTKRRCLIPADGFYEWQKLDAKRKQPWYFTSTDGPLAFAGLWESWHDPTLASDAPPLRTCTIVTTKANSDMRDVHDRMPLVLTPADFETWLDVNNDSLEEAEHLLHAPPPPKLLTGVRVSDKVNSTNNDDPELIKAIADAHQ